MKREPVGEFGDQFGVPVHWRAIVGHASVPNKPPTPPGQPAMVPVAEVAAVQS